MKAFELNGVQKNVPQGFSWSTLFFGFFVPLFRGDLKWAAIMLAVGVLGAVFTLWIGTIIGWIVFACIYNRKYEEDLRLQGWKEIS